MCKQFIKDLGTIVYIECTLISLLELENCVFNNWKTGHFLIRLFKL